MSSVIYGEKRETQLSSLKSPFRNRRGSPLQQDSAVARSPLDPEKGVGERGFPGRVLSLKGPQERDVVEEDPLSLSRDSER